jgi:hypothetical protein
MVCDFLLKSPWTRWLRSCDLRLMVIHELLFGGHWAEPGFTRERRQDSPERRNGFGAADSRAVPRVFEPSDRQGARARRRTRLVERKQLGTSRQTAGQPPETTGNREISVTTPVTTRGPSFLDSERKSLILWRTQKELNLQPSDP